MCSSDLIAANATQLALVVATDPSFSDELVMRAIAAAEHAGLGTLIILNKADLADPLAIARLRRREPGAIVVSALTGEGIDELLRALDERLPHPQVEVDVVIPYNRGDLVASAHRLGEALAEDHLPDGTRLHALVSPELAARMGVVITP